MAAETLDEFLNRTKPAGGDTAATPATAAPAAGGPAVDPVDAFLRQTKPGPMGIPGTPVLSALAPPSGASPVFSRIADAAVKGWQDTPNFWTDQGWNALEHPLAGAPPAVQSLLEPTVAAVTRGIVRPAGDLISGALGVGSALMRGGQQTVQEAGTAVGQPQLGRDIAAIPEAFAGDVRFQMPRTEKPTYKGASDMAGADAVASNHYKIADNSQTTFAPDFVNTALDSINPRTDRQLAKEATEGRTVVTDQLERLDKFRDKPMTVQQWQGLNEGLNTAIGREIKLEGITPEGRQLQQIQRQLRQQVENAGEGDIVSGGREGLDALKSGNAAYSQARKMEVVEKIQEYAAQTANPTTSIKQQVRTLVRNEKKTRGWSEDELTALQDAADRGRLGDFIHTMGNRLAVPLAATAAIPVFETLTGGSPGTISAVAAPLVGSAAAYMAGSPFRGLGEVLSNRRMQNTLDVLGQRVPPNPLSMRP